MHNRRRIISGSGVHDREGRGQQSYNVSEPSTKENLENPYL